ncbi:MAG: class I SAM-dependent methyltransferase [Lentisphaeria bacterium]|jgi:ubiquinone/menaquinone biosynthesis C-methylase UbiE
MAMPGSLRDCLRLNLRMLRHVFANRWLDAPRVGAGYDRVAPDYDRNWLSQLRPVTGQLLAELPASLPPGELLDLGCGTGHGTVALARRFPDRPLHALDISPGMLAQARAKLAAGSGAAGGQIQWHCADMLPFLRGRPAGSAALILSTWAIGYSQPQRLVREAARVLAPGGVFAFVVNLHDTLRPLFLAFHRTLLAFPAAAGCALHPRFPRSGAELRRRLEESGLQVCHLAEGRHPVAPPPGAAGSRFDWLLRTGVLAGFDAVLPLHDPAHPATRRLRAEVEALAEPLTHHYVLALARKPAARTAPCA